MATEADLEGLFVGADHTVEYTDSDDPPTDMSGWTVVLDIRESVTSGTALVSVTGVVSGTYNSTAASNTQKVTFTLTDDNLSASVFTGANPTVYYSIKRTDTGFEQPLRHGKVPFNRVTQV